MSIVYWIILFASLALAWQIFNPQKQLARKVWKSMDELGRSSRRDAKMTALQRSLKPSDTTKSELIGENLRFSGRLTDSYIDGTVMIDLEVDKGISMYLFHSRPIHAKFHLSLADAAELRKDERYSFVGRLANIKCENMGGIGDTYYGLHGWATLEFTEVVLS